MTGTPKSRIRTMDMPILDEVFVMGDGFVLNFSNRTFADFFRKELQSEPAYGSRYVERAVGIPREQQCHP